MKKIDGKRILKSKYCIVLIASVLIGLIVTCVVFFKDSGRNAAVSSILFSFDGAAKYALELEKEDKVSQVVTINPEMFDCAKTDSHSFSTVSA